MNTYQQSDYSCDEYLITWQPNEPSRSQSAPHLVSGDGERGSRCLGVSVT